MRHVRAYLPFALLACCYAAACSSSDSSTAGDASVGASLDASGNANGDATGASADASSESRREADGRAPDGSSLDGGACSDGSCSCPPSYLVCNGQCVDPATDPANCGACQTPCAGQCVGGQCHTACSVALYVVVDTSASTVTNLEGSTSRLQGMVNAVGAFVDEPASQGIGFGLVHDPVPAAGPTTCAPGTECDNGGSCCPTGMTCIATLGCFNGGATAASSCNVADYATPDVAVGALPGVATAVHAALMSYASNGQSPEIPALEAAIAYAKSLAASTKVAVVFFADGPWTACPPAGDAGATGDGQPVAAVAQTAFTGTPSIPTYVVGVSDTDTTYFDLIANAGGTFQAHAATSEAAILAALEQIRDAVKAACP